jgi:hypothetical protein
MVNAAAEVRAARTQWKIVGRDLPRNPAYASNQDNERILE